MLDGGNKRWHTWHFAVGERLSSPWNHRRSRAQQAARDDNPLSDASARRAFRVTSTPFEPCARFDDGFIAGGVALAAGWCSG